MHIHTTRSKKQGNVWYSTKEKPSVVSQKNTSYIYREMNIERRMDVRLTVNEGIYAVMASYSPQICQICDMGHGGMSYIYFKDDDPVVESKTLDILVTGFGFCLEGIPFRKVEDYRVIDDTVTGCFEKRVACIEFIDLTDEQKERITDFVIKYVEKTVN